MGENPVGLGAGGGEEGVVLVAPRRLPGAGEARDVDMHHGAVEGLHLHISPESDLRTLPGTKPRAAALIVGSSCAVAEPIVGAAPAGRVSIRTLFSLSVKTVAAPSRLRAHPSGTLTEKPGSPVLTIVGLPSV